MFKNFFDNKNTEKKHFDSFLASVKKIIIEKHI